MGADKYLHAKIYDKGEDNFMRKRERRIDVYFTEDEFQHFRKLQKQSKLNQRDFILNCIKHTPITVKPHGDEIVRELKAIGNNLNQLTRKVNSGQIRNCNTELHHIYTDIEVMMSKWQ